MTNAATCEKPREAPVTGGTNDATRSHSPLVAFKVKFSHKAAAFLGAVIALSWFFEGCRRVKEAWTLEHALILFGGTALTVLFVGVQSYWIYMEEKFKGNLKKRIDLFEKIYVHLQRGEG